MKSRLGLVRYRDDDGETAAAGEKVVEVYHGEQWHYLGWCTGRKHAQFARRQFQFTIDAIIAEATR